MEVALYTWGWGKYGQLGHGDEQNQAAPKPLDRVLLQGQVISQLSAGVCFTVALSKRGDVYTWGYGKQLQLGQENRSNQMIPRKIKFFQKKGVVMVATGREHSVAVLRGGEVYTWGSGVYGQLGHGEVGDAAEPRLVEGLAGNARGDESTKSISIVEIPEDEDSDVGRAAKTSNDPTPADDTEYGSVHIVEVACGSYHTLALDQNGIMYSWGLGLDGRLGHGGQENELQPRRITSLEDERASMVRCGWEHSAMVCRTRGHVYTWGSGRNFQLGGRGLEGNLFDMRDTPTKVIQWAARTRSGNAVAYLDEPPRIKDLSCGGKHNMAISVDGELFSWGRGEFGRLGHGDQRHKIFPVKVQALADTHIDAVACGGYHSLALARDGTLYVWGNNEDGRLGIANGNDLYVTQPTPVPATRPGHNTRLTISHIFAGTYISLAFGSENAKSSASFRDYCAIL